MQRLFFMRPFPRLVMTEVRDMKKGRKMRPFPRFGAVDRRRIFPNGKSVGSAIADCLPARGKHNVFPVPSRLLKLQFLSTAKNGALVCAPFFMVRLTGDGFSLTENPSATQSQIACPLR